MVQTCYIKGCQSQADRNNRISFFSFPSKNCERQQWQDKIFRLNKQNCNSVSKFSRICEFHFNEIDMKRSNWRCILKEGAEPTIFPNGESGRDKNKSSQPINTSEELIDVEYLDEVLEENSADVQYLGLTQSNETSIDLNNCNIDETMLVDPVEPTKSMSSIEEWSTENYSVDDTVICQNCGYSNSLVTTSYLHEHGVSSSNTTTTPKTPLADQNKSCSADHSRQCIVKNESINLPARGVKRRLCYPGDVKENEDLTPRSSKKFIRNLKMTVTKQRMKIRNLHKRRRRALKRISTLKDLVNDLKKKNLVSNNALESLKVFGHTLERVVQLCLSHSSLLLNVK